MKNLLVEILPVNSAGVPTTVRMSSQGVSRDGQNLDGKVWLPLITSMPTMTFELTNQGQLKPVDISYGEIEFIVSPFYDNEDWANWDWNGAPLFVWLGEDGDDFSDYELKHTGTAGPIGQAANAYATLPLLGLEGELDKPLLTASYTGTDDEGGPNGFAALKGILKPWLSGFVQNMDCSPHLIDRPNLVYQLHGYGPIHGITALYEHAQSLGPSVGDAGDYAALVALTLAPGQWATCHAEGMFRIGGLPSKKLTADVMGAKDGLAYPDNARDIAQHLIKQGLPASTFGSWGSWADKDWCFYTNQQITVGEVVRLAVKDAGGFFMPDEAGEWQSGSYYFPQDTGQHIRDDRTAEPLVDQSSITQPYSSGPVWKVRVGGERCWSVHSIGDISPSIGGSAIDEEARETAADALAAATAAAADAEAAKDAVDGMVSDGVLDRVEKKSLKQRHAELTAEKTGLVAKAVTYGVTVQSMAYTTTFTALDTYLGTLSPAWNGNAETPVDRTVFTGKWNDLYQAREALLLAIANAPIWSGIQGPNKPQDNATVGAPNGTMVGGKLAQDVIGAVTDTSGNLIQSRQLQNTIDELTDETTGVIAVINDKLSDTEAARAAAVAAQEAAEQAVEDAGEQAADAQANAVVASNAAATLFPDRYVSGTETNFTTGGPGSPETIASVESNATLSGYGPVRQGIANGTTTVFDWGQKAVLSATAGRTYEVTAEINVLSFTGVPRLQVALRGLDASYATISNTASPVNITTTGTLILTARFSNIASTGITAWAAGSVWLRPFARLTRATDNTGTVEAQFKRLTVRDVTEVKAATDASVIATTAAGAAGDSATAANSVLGQARVTVANGPIFPSDFSQDGKFWIGGVNGYTGDPATRTPITSNSTFSFANITGIGRVLQVNSAIGTVDVSTLGARKLAANRTYKVTAQVRTTSASGTRTAQVIFAGLLANYSYQGSSAYGGAITNLVNGTWTELTLTLPSATVNAWLALATPPVHFRPLIRLGGTTATYELASLLFEDITESKAAEGHANASFNSYQNANSRATDAESWAVAAQGFRNEAETFRGNALSYAGQANDYKAAASDSAAAAQASATLSASLGVNSINENPAFSAWSNASGLPDKYGWWDSGGALSRVAGPRGGYAARLTVAANTNSGLRQGVAESTGMQAGRLPPGWYVLEAEVKLISGSLQGSGVYVGFHNASNVNVIAHTINFATEPDSSNTVVGAGVVGRTYRFDKLVQVTNTAATQGIIHPMANWDGFGTRAAKTIDFNRCLIRQATNVEIARQTVLEPLSSTVSSHTSAISTLEGNLATTNTTLTAYGVTSSGNLLSNSDFAADTSGWYTSGSVAATEYSRNGAGDGWRPVGENNLAIYSSGAQGGTGQYSDWWSVGYAAEVGKWYEGSMYVAMHRCASLMYIGFFSETGASLGYTGSATTAVQQWSGGPSLSNWGRLYAKAQAPAGTASVQILFRKHVSPNGGEDSWGWFTRPQIKEASQSASSPQAYTPSNSGASIRQTNATVSSYSSAISSLQGNQATLYARAGVRTDVNGYIVGYEINNNGSQGNAYFNVNTFALLKPGGGERIEFYNGAMHVFDAGGVKRVQIGNLSA